MNPVTIWSLFNPPPGVRPGDLELVTRSYGKSDLLRITIKTNKFQRGFHMANFLYMNCQVNWFWKHILLCDIMFELTFFSLWLHLRHMEVPRLGVQLELELPAYTTATATPDLSCVCNLHSSLQRKPDPLTHWSRPGVKPLSLSILVRYLTCWVTMGTPELIFDDNLFLFNT